MKKFLLSAVAFGAFAMPAMAADLSAPLGPVPYDWSGFYIGGNVGWGFAESNWDVRDDIGRLGSFSVNPDGFLGGGQIGFNFDSNGFIWGGEAEFTFGGGSDGGWFDDAGIYDGRSKVNFLMTLGPKVGIAMDRTLLYVEGGLALADLDHRFREIGVDSRGSSGTRTGWFVGAGGEYAFDDNWSARLEYNYVDMDSQRFSLIAADERVRIDNYMHVIKAGINYKF